MISTLEQLRSLYAQPAERAVRKQQDRLDSHCQQWIALSPMLVMATVIGYGVLRHGFGFLKLFVPSDVPKWLLPFITLIEIVSFMSRPISLSLRLFANLLGGHIALKVFGS